MIEPLKPFFLICALLVCVGMARVAFYECYVNRNLPSGKGIDARYAQLWPLLAPTGRFGYLTDERFVRALDSVRYTQALYALAPRVLVLDAPDADFWLADLSDPASLGEVARRRDLEPVAIFDDGRIALLRRKQGK